jgi:hypothetical protein
MRRLHRPARWYLCDPSPTLDGTADGVVPANDGRSSAAKFSGSRSHRVVENAGHNLPEELRGERTQCGNLHLRKR